MNRSFFALTAAVFLTALCASTNAFAEADAAAGKVIYDANCMSCHGATGKGDGPVGKALTPPPRDFSQGEFKFDTDSDGTAGTDADIKAVLEKGAMAFGGSPLMAPWPALSDEDISNIIAHIRTLKE